MSQKMQIRRAFSPPCPAGAVRRQSSCNPPSSIAQDPALLTQLVPLSGTKFRANAPNGVAFATSVYLCPPRSLPTRCRRDAPTRRHMHRANAWRRLVPSHPPQADSTVSSFARLLRVFDRLPTGSSRNRLFKKQHSRHEGRHDAPPTGGSQIHAGKRRDGEKSNSPAKRDRITHRNEGAFGGPAHYVPPFT